MITLLKIAIIVGVILASALIAYVVDRDQALYILAGIAGLGGITILLRWPALTLILTILAGFFIHFQLSNGLNAAVGIIAILPGLWLGKMFIIDHKLRLAPSNTNLPAIVFIILALISFGMGFLPFVPFASPASLTAQAGGMIIFVLSALTFLAMGQFVEIRWLKWTMWTFIAVGALYMVGRILSSQGIHIGRPFAPGATTNSMFWTWLVAMTFGQAYFNKRLHPAIRGGLFFLTLLTFYIAFVLSNDWKSGWVPIIIVIVSMLGFRYWKPTLMLAPIGLIGAVIAAYLIIGTDQYSWGTRVDAWLIVIEIAKASPLFGLGFANYYWYSRFFPIRGWYVPFNSHSQYVDIIAQTGILGLICFLWIFWEVGRLGWKLRELAPEGFERAYVYSVLGGTIGTLVAAALVDWVLPFAYNIGFNGFRSSILAWIFLGGLVTIEQHLRQEPDSKTGIKNVS